MIDQSKLPSVLVVEDDEDMRTLLADFVRRCGCQALEASDADGALFALREHRVKAIMTDYCLGDASETGCQMLCRAQQEGLLGGVGLVKICTGTPSVVPPATLPLATVLRKPIDLEEIGPELAALGVGEERGGEAEPSACDAATARVRTHRGPREKS